MTTDPLFDQAVHVLTQTATDPALPYSERLYQAAGAAVGFALQLVDCSPVEWEEMLQGHETHSEQAGEALAASIAAFAAPPIQEELRAAALVTNTPILALAAALILHHFLTAHAEAVAQEQPYLLEMATAYCLRFTLTWARLYPDQARSYRELIPTPEAAPTRRRSRKRCPKNHS